MSHKKYTVKQLPVETLTSYSTIDDKDKKLIESFSINNSFIVGTHIMQLSVYSVDNTLLEFLPQYNSFSLLQNASSAGKDGASNITIDPIKDAEDLGYANGDVRLYYKFIDDLYNKQAKLTQFYIESISPDRTEIRALCLSLTPDEIRTTTTEIANKLNSTSYFSEFNVTFAEDDLLAINITTEQISSGLSVVIKLYEPLPGNISIKDTFSINEKVSDSLLFDISTQILEDEIKLPRLKGPNFNVDEVQENNNPTQYFDYNELFSYPVTSSYYQLRSLFSEKSVDVSIDHKDYSNFIHFSSAEERLRNFKYKVDLIDSYNGSIESIKNTGYTKLGVSGSIGYYEGLIDGIVRNFDHYDRYLYYESGSYAWPKSNSIKPYINQSSSTNEAISWYNDQIVIAQNFDENNFDILSNTIPSFIRDDQNNEPYVMFIHMIAQHFDNLWIYFKAVSDKYDGDNRLNFGISKDLVRDAVESLGFKLYNSNQNLGDLMSLFTGESYQTGSEVVNEIVLATSGSGSDYLQPLAKDDYLKEVYKRIYHNLPLITKAKGTERGIRALVNSFGIPSKILPLKIYGGTNKTQQEYLGDSFVTSSISKVRLNNTGSLITGSTLSQYTSIRKKKKNFSDDLRSVELGFDIAEQAKRYYERLITGSFNIDDYIGDPDEINQDHYYKLKKTRETLLNTSDSLEWEDLALHWEDADWQWQEGNNFRTPFAFIRLIRFFDNSIFRIIKNLIPARANVNVGVVIKPDVLSRSKGPNVSVSWENKIYTGSIPVAEITSSNAGAFGNYKPHEYSTNYSASVVSPIGVIPLNVTDEKPRLTGEFSGSHITITTGELNPLNIYKQINQPFIDFDLTVFNKSLPVPPSCNITLGVTYLGEFYTVYGEPDGGFVQVTYPSSQTATSGSLTYTNNHDVYSFFTVEATPVYPQTFVGWYTQANGSGSLVSTENTLNVTFALQQAYGDTYYANFTGGYIY